jgi:hypothetical protein
MNFSVTMCGSTHLPAIVPQPYYDSNSELDNRLPDMCRAKYNLLDLNVSFAYMSSTGLNPYDKLVPKLAERISTVCLVPYDFLHLNVSCACTSAIPPKSHDDPGHKIKKNNSAICLAICARCYSNNVIRDNDNAKRLDAMWKIYCLISKLKYKKTSSLEYTIGCLTVLPICHIACLCTSFMIYRVNPLQNLYNPVLPQNITTRNKGTQHCGRG